MEERLGTIEAAIGRPADAGGLFRARYDRGKNVGGGAATLGSVVAAIGWLVRRTRSDVPNYMVLAVAGDTLFAFAAGVATGSIGDEILRHDLADVSVTRSGTWDIDIAVGRSTLRLTCVSCDRPSLLLIERLTAHDVGPAG